MNKMIAIPLLFSIITQNLLAVNYYISQNGDDNANGLTTATAWASIDKINENTFSAGDSILFEKGGIWREQLLEVPSSGAEGNHIVFASYGTGAAPRLYGSRALTSFTAHPSLSNIYNGDSSVPVNPADYDSRSYRGSIFFIIDGSVTWGDGLEHYKTHVDSLISNYQWTWQNDTVYFYYDGTIDDIDTVECTQAERAINVRTEYVTIDGFNIRYWGSRCIGSTVYPESRRDGLHIRNCELAYTASREEGVGYGVQLFHSNMIIENNRVHDNGRRNISLNITNQTGSCTMRDIIVQDNQLYDGWHTCGVDLAIQGVNHTVRNITIRRNVIRETYGIDKNRHAIAMNFIENNGDSGDIDSLFFYNNVVMNGYGTGIMLNQISNAFVVNNTFSGSQYTTGTGMSAFVYHNTSSTGNTTVMNNIFFNYAMRSDKFYVCLRGPSTRWDSIDCNLYHVLDESNDIMAEVDGNSYRVYEFSDVQSAGYELNSPEPQAALFVDSLRDLRLTTASPAIEAGCPVSFVTTDIEGNPRDPVIPDIGAYEYTPGNVPDARAPALWTPPISLHSHPVTDYLTVTIGSHVRLPGKAVLSNLSGEKILEKTFFTNHETMHMAGCKSGIYIFTFFPCNSEPIVYEIIHRAKAE